MNLRIAIVGRPNVGKSTLFNRLAGRKLALVHDTPGVTRDWREAEARLGDLAFTVVDTAGFEDAADGLSPRMRAQTERALEGADAALFMIDARAGVTPLDEHFAQWLRRRGLPVVLLANKAESGAAEAGRLEAFKLGFGEPAAISAEHGEGMGEIYDALRALLPEPDEAEQEAEDRGYAEKPLRLAVVGRPNVGKSTLVNRWLGEERMLTGPEPGITRDSIASRFSWHGRKIQLADTAGLRRRARVTEKLESMSGADTLRAVRFAEVVVVVLDAEAALEKQDLTIARLVTEEGRALVLALNKWDRVADRQRFLREVRRHAEEALSQVQGLALVPCSALTGDGVDKVMQAVLDAHATWNRRISTGELNRWLAAALDAHPPPMVQGRPLRIRYISQIKARPPTFVLFANKPGELPKSYLRYLTNGLRETFGLSGVPIRMEMRKGENPYAAKRRKR